MNIDLEGAACDSEAARLLPWYVSGRLTSAEATRVAQHVEHCRICRSDLQEQQSLRASIKAEATIDFAPQAGLAATLARIDELGRDLAAPRQGPRGQPEPERLHRRANRTRWLAAAVVVQAIGLASLAGAMLSRSPTLPATPKYQTLSTPVPIPVGPHIRAVFSKSMAVGDLQLLLQAQRLSIVAGPTEAGVFTLGVQGHDLNATLRGLRADAQVRFAEPVGTEGASAQ